MGNFRDFFERFRNLNIGSNQQLEALVEQAQELLRGVSPDQVRTLPAVRQQLQAGMADVRRRLDSLVIDAPRRRIIRAQPQLQGGSRAASD
ncbi:MAG: hypothetical protein K2R98_31740 [Gemmataceae bacterium]|nr:hypothetical protein [Gemmataceae bacterium]